MRPKNRKPPGTIFYLKWVNMKLPVSCVCYWRRSGRCDTVRSGLLARLNRGTVKRNYAFEKKTCAQKIEFKANSFFLLRIASELRSLSLFHPPGRFIVASHLPVSRRGGTRPRLYNRYRKTCAQKIEKGWTLIFTFRGSI